MTTTATPARSTAPASTRLGVDADTFADIAQTTVSDRDVIRGLREAGARPARDAWFDPVLLNRQLRENGS